MLKKLRIDFINIINKKGYIGIISSAKNLFVRLIKQMIPLCKEFNVTYKKYGLKHAILNVKSNLSYDILKENSEVESYIIRDSKKYWDMAENKDQDLKDYSHWSGEGIWVDTERWRVIGRVNYEMFENMAAIMKVDRPIQTMVEWGQGGGANAIHFASEVKTFYGVEISHESINECQRQLNLIQFNGYKGILIDPEDPEDAILKITEPCDFFLSTYVFPHFPGKNYGKRVTKIAYKLLRTHGMALIQIRYDDGSDYFSQKRRNYKENAMNFTSYKIDEYWKIAEDIGFTPYYVYLMTRRGTYAYSGDNYAYYFLKK